MRFKLQENAIVSHHINSFCLVCECNLDSEALALQHIDQDEHQQSLRCFPYLEKYKDDRIRMVKMGYYCDYCTKFISTATEIDPHVSNTNHYNKKLDKSWQRVNGVVIAFNKVIVDDTAWHSVSGNKCFICNTVFKDEGVHKSEDSHLIKLVQSKVDLHEEGIYRKMDSDIFQCLTCNTVLASGKMEKHFKCDEHKIIYAECQYQDETINKMYKKIKATAECNISDMPSDPKAEEASSADKKNDFKSIATSLNIEVPNEVIHFDKNIGVLNTIDNDDTKNLANVKQFDNTLSNATAFETDSIKENENNTCPDFEDNTIKAKSSHNNNVDHLFNFNMYDDHQNAYDDFTGLKQDSQIPSLICDTDDYKILEADKLYLHAAIISTEREDTEPGDTVESFAERHELIVTKRETHVTCLLCTVKVVYTMPEMQQHVFSRKHRTKTSHMARHHINLYTSQIVPARQMIPFRMAAVDFLWRKHFTQNDNDVLLNNTYRLSFDSYHLYYSVPDMRKMCHVCDNKVPFKDINHHNLSGIHQIMMNLSLVVTELRDEFIREILPNKFHCGFCNLVLPSFRDLKDHMRGRCHRNMKLDAYTRLHQVLPLVGQANAISSIMQGNTFIPNWAGRNNPGIY